MDRKKLDTRESDELENNSLLSIAISTLKNVAAVLKPTQRKRGIREGMASLCSTTFYY